MRKATLASVLGVCLVVGQLAAAGPAVADPGLVVQDLTTSLTANDLAQTIVGSGVSISNVAFTGANVAAGEFSGGGTGSSAIIGFDQGVVLSTGATGSVVGPNTSDTITTENGTAGDGDLDGLLPAGTVDAGCIGPDLRLHTERIGDLPRLRLRLGRVQRVRRARLQRCLRLLRERPELRDRRLPLPCRSTRSTRTPTPTCSATTTSPVAPRSTPRWTD